LRGPARVKITDFTTPVTSELSTIKSIGTDMVYSPLLAIDDADAHIFGRYEWNNAPASAYKKFPEWTSVVLGTCTSEYELLRAIFRQAGCTIRCETGDIIMENDTVFAVHSCHSGPLVFRLPPDCRGLKDIYSGNTFMVSNGFVHTGYAKSKGDTRLFRKIKKNRLK